MHSQPNRSFNVTIPSLIENKSDLLNLPIKSNDNSVVFLKDVADIRDSFKERKGFARNNGENAVILEVSKGLERILLKPFLK